MSLETYFVASEPRRSATNVIFLFSGH